MDILSSIWFPILGILKNFWRLIEWSRLPPDWPPVSQNEFITVSLPLIVSGAISPINNGATNEPKPKSHDESYYLFYHNGNDDPCKCNTIIFIFAAAAIINGTQQ